MLVDDMEILGISELALIAAVAQQIMCFSRYGSYISDWFACAGAIAMIYSSVLFCLSHGDLKSGMRVTRQRLAVERYSVKPYEQKTFGLI